MYRVQHQYSSYLQVKVQPYDATSIMNTFTPGIPELFLLCVSHIRGALGIVFPDGF